MNFTEEQIKQLSPDESSTKAGLQLATTSKWVKAFSHEKALWGACQGSGKDPYLTMIDLQALAFKCNCPSRKFPCKHGLGLLFLYLKHPVHFKSENEPDALVMEWINKREQKNEKASIKAEKPVDEKAQQKRAEQRLQKVDLGISELEVWMKDLVRTGIQQVPQNIYSFSSNIRARMIDAQAPGLANRLRELESINFYDKGWEEKFVSKLSKIFLITKAYRNSELNDKWKHEIKQYVGWNVSKEEVQEQEAVSDLWFVAGIERTQLDQIWSEKQWLFGIKTNRFAYVMNFYANNQLPQVLFIAGSIIQADIHFYPSVLPLRCMVNEYKTELNKLTMLNAESSIERMLKTHSERYSILPLLEQSPFILNNVVVNFFNAVFYVTDSESISYPLNIEAEKGWAVIAFSRGTQINVFGFIQDAAFKIISFWSNEQFYSINEL